MNRYRAHLFVMCVLALVAVSGAQAVLLNALTAMRFGWVVRPASGQIVLVAIDSPSIDTIGVWPWPRGAHAELIRILESAGVADIAFDIDFSSRSSGVGDRVFEEALREAGGSVILPAFKQAALGRGTQTVIHTDRPLAEFNRHAWIGTVNIVPDADGILRRYRFGEEIEGEFLPSLAALLAGRYDKRAGSFLIDFGVDAGSVPTVSYKDVLRRDPAALGSLKGRKVIVGGTAVELGDRVNVPNGRVIPGAVLQALATESILQGRTLQLSSPVVTLGGIAVVVLAMVVLWRRCALGVRITLLAASSIGIEMGASVLQALTPVVIDTSLFHAAVLAYLVATALDEIDARGLLGLIAERRFQQIAMSLGDGLVCVNSDGRITVWNAGAAAIFGHEAKEMIGQPFDRIFGQGDTEPNHTCRITELPIDVLQAPGGKVMELEGRRKHGERFPFEVCFSAWQGTDGIQYGAVLRDISVRKREEDRIRYLASYDTLTGLPNRNTLDQHLQTALDAAKAQGHGVALLMLGLDKFKDINDSLGHAYGDQVLRDVAKRLAALVGGDGLVARFGGDAFAIVIGGEGVVERARSLSESISGSFKQRGLLVNGHELFVSCSIGVALYPRDCDQLHELLGNADLAMFHAKAAGRGRHVFFDAAIRDELEDRLSLTAELERAAERGEFELFYQPQFRLKDFRLVGAEALIRWRHPERGLVPPGAFLPVLETMSQMDEVSLWVLKSACRQGRIWQRSGHAIRIGVNLSPGQFKSGDLAGTIAAVLADTGLSPWLLELEVTENILLDDDRKAREVFRRIRELGAGVALDDFGTGYASLSFLKNFPLNRLKIDQSFVRELEPGSDDAAIVEYTARLSRRLGLEVIAEGIETRATADLVAAMECEEGQGYYFGRPMPAAEFEREFLGSSAVPALSGSAATANAA